MHILLSTTAVAGILSILAAIAAEKMDAPISIIGSWVILKLSYNPHIAFSIALPKPLMGVLIFVAVCAVSVAAYQHRTHRFLSVAFGLILGGAAANIVDRLADGFVTDYIAVFSFPIFNLADTCITIGAALLLLETWLSQRKNI